MRVFIIYFSFTAYFSKYPESFVGVAPENIMLLAWPYWLKYNKNNWKKHVQL